MNKKILTGSITALLLLTPTVAKIANQEINGSFAPKSQTKDATTDWIDGTIEGYSSSVEDETIAGINYDDLAVDYSWNFDSELNGTFQMAIENKSTSHRYTASEIDAIFSDSYDNGALSGGGFSDPYHNFQANKDSLGFLFRISTDDGFKAVKDGYETTSALTGTDGVWYHDFMWRAPSAGNTSDWGNSQELKWDETSKSFIYTGGWGPRNMNWYYNSPSDLTPRPDLTPEDWTAWLATQDKSHLSLSTQLVPMTNQYYSDATVDDGVTLKTVELSLNDAVKDVTPPEITGMSTTPHQDSIDLAYTYSGTAADADHEAPVITEAILKADGVTEKDITASFESGTQTLENLDLNKEYENIKIEYKYTGTKNPAEATGEVLFDNTTTLKGEAQDPTDIVVQDPVVLDPQQAEVNIGYEITVPTDANYEPTVIDKVRLMDGTNELSSSTDATGTLTFNREPGVEYKDLSVKVDANSKTDVLSSAVPGIIDIFRSPAIGATDITASSIANGQNEATITGNVVIPATDPAYEETVITGVNIEDSTGASITTNVAVDSTTGDFTYSATGLPAEYNDEWTFIVIDNSTNSGHVKTTTPVQTSGLNPAQPITSVTIDNPATDIITTDPTAIDYTINNPNLGGNIETLITKVELINKDNKVVETNTGNNFSGTFNYTAEPGENNTLTVKAYDNISSEVTSTPINVTVPKTPATEPTIDSAIATATGQETAEVDYELTIPAADPTIEPTTVDSVTVIDGNLGGATVTPVTGNNETGKVTISGLTAGTTYSGTKLEVTYNTSEKITKAIDNFTTTNLSPAEEIDTINVDPNTEITTEGTTTLTYSIDDPTPATGYEKTTIEKVELIKDGSVLETDDTTKAFTGTFDVTTEKGDSGAYSIKAYDNTGHDITSDAIEVNVPLDAAEDPIITDFSVSGITSTNATVNYDITIPSNTGHTPTVVEKTVINVNGVDYDQGNVLKGKVDVSGLSASQSYDATITITWNGSETTTQTIKFETIVGGVTAPVIDNLQHVSGINTIDLTWDYSVPTVPGEEPPIIVGAMIKADGVDAEIVDITTGKYTMTQLGLNLTYRNIRIEVQYKGTVNTTPVTIVIDFGDIATL